MLDQSSQAMLLYSMARTYSRAGNSDKAMDLLLRAFNMGLCCFEKLEEDESFDPMRSEIRFLSLIEAAKLVSFTVKLESSEPDSELLLPAMEKACEMSSEYAYSFFLLARLYARRGYSEKAITALRKAVDLGFKNFCAIVGERDFSAIKGTEGFKDLFKKRNATGPAHRKAPGEA